MKLEDIANLAQVSKSAVSMALNDKPGISSKTREKILNIVRETGYLPRSIVKADQVYSTAKTLRFVACVNSGIVIDQYDKLPFFMELMHYIEELGRSLGYSLFFSSIQRGDLVRDIDYLEKEHASNGILLLGTNLNQSEIDLVAHRNPNLVVLDTCFETVEKTDFVVMNNRLGGYQAGSYLLGMGHRNIGYVHSQSRMFNFDIRKKGFLSALDKYGVKIAEENHFHAAPTIVTSQEEFKQKIIDRKTHLPTALFCECDYIAISVIKSLTELGINVPNDISIVGFDNIPEATIISPELTTVNVDKEKMAAVAVRRLVEIIEQKDTSRIKSIIDTTFVERKSCRKLP